MKQSPATTKTEKLKWIRHFPEMPAEGLVHILRTNDIYRKSTATVDILRHIRICRALPPHITDINTGTWGWWSLHPNRFEELKHKVQKILEGEPALSAYQTYRKLPGASYFDVEAAVLELRPNP